MKYRVLSIRVPQPVLVYCYDILKLGSVPIDGMALSTAVVTALERISSSLITDGRLKMCETDRDSDERLTAYIKPSLWAGEPLTRLNTNLVENPPTIQLRDGEEDEDLPEDRKKRIEALIETAVGQTMEREAKELEDKVRSNSLYNEGGDLVADLDRPQVSMRKLEDMGMIAEEDCLADKLYAETETEHLKLALRIVYKNLPLDMWSSSTAKRLALILLNQYAQDIALNKSHEGGK